ncbi:MAG: DUF1801 domain-containing protein [Bacteroidales bacterium]|nr:DUF1801 domain-containing protein [Bacteroidales bacterium]
MEKTIKHQQNDIDKYISTFSADVQTLLEQIRSTIKQAAPEAEEAIKYAMPTFVLNGNLIHFAAYKNHIGLYPTPSGIGAFQEELSVYKNAKGSVQFPINKPLPLELIKKIALFRVQENLQKIKTKKSKK